MNIYMYPGVADVFDVHVQPIACGVAFNLNLQSQSYWSFFHKPWQKRPREHDHRL